MLSQKNQKYINKAIEKYSKTFLKNYVNSGYNCQKTIYPILKKLSVRYLKNVLEFYFLNKCTEALIKSKLFNKNICESNKLKLIKKKMNKFSSVLNEASLCLLEVHNFVK